MSGLQTIIDRCESIEFDRRKVVGLQITRNEVLRASVTPTFQPWRINLLMPPALLYSESRELLEALDTLDRNVPQVVTFGNNPCLSWIFRYQGAMSAAQISAITVVSFTGNQLVLQNLTGPASKVLFEPNDLIQIGNIPHPFTVQSQVLRGTGATVTVTTHRPNIISTNVVGQTIKVGNGCEFNMVCMNMPTYSLLPGGYKKNQFGTVINNARLDFSDEFMLYEQVATA